MCAHLTPHSLFPAHPFLLRLSGSSIPPVLCLPSVRLEAKTCKLSIALKVAKWCWIVQSARSSLRSASPTEPTSSSRSTTTFSSQVTGRPAGTGHSLKLSRVCVPVRVFQSRCSLLIHFVSEKFRTCVFDKQAHVPAGRFTAGHAHPRSLRLSGVCVC